MIARQLATSGLKFDWRHRPPTVRRPHARHITSGAEARHVLALAQALEARGAATEIDPRSAPPGTYIRCFTLPKPGKATRRLLLDAREVNHFMRPAHYKLPSLATFLELAEETEADAGFSLDISDAFYMTEVSPRDRRHFRFAVTDRGASTGLRVFELKGLCMGAALSPLLHQKTMDIIASRVRRLTELGPARAPSGSALTLQYLDDHSTSLARHLSTAQKAAVHATAAATFEAAGMPVSASKSSPSPLPEVRILGFVVSFPRKLVSVPSDKLTACRRLLARFLRSERPTALHRAIVLGTLRVLSPGCRLAAGNLSGLCQSLGQLLNAPTEHTWELTRQTLPRALYSNSMPISRMERTQLSRFLAALTQASADPWHPGFARSFSALPAPGPRTIVVASDACKSGAGSHVVEPSAGTGAPRAPPAQTSWSTLCTLELPPSSGQKQSTPLLPLSWAWTPAERARPIAALEATSAVRGIVDVASRLRTFPDPRTHVHCLSDSAATVAALRRLGSSSVNMDEALQPLRRLVQHTGLAVTAGFLPGKRNVWADALSRRFETEADRAVAAFWANHHASSIVWSAPTEPLPSAHPLAEATLSPQARDYFALSFRIVHDLFATSENRTTASFSSWSGLRGAASADALAADWSLLAQSAAARLHVHPGPPSAPTLLAFPPAEEATVTRALRRALHCPDADVLLVWPKYLSWPCTQLALARAHKAWDLPPGSVIAADGSPIPHPRVWTCALFSHAH